MRASSGVPLLLAVLAVVVSARPVLAQAKKDCSQAYEQAQVLRQDSKLRQAREKLLICAAAACPARMRDECTTWSGELQKEIPTVIVSFRTPQGSDVSGARLLVDGEVAAESLQGTEVAIDPGKHVLRVEASDKPAKEREVVLALGERGRKIDFVTEPPTPAPKAPPPATAPKKPSDQTSTALPVSFWVLGGVGVLGLGVGTYVGLGALGKRSDLDACKPACDRDDVDRVERDYIISEVAIGVGLVALGAATFIAVGSRKESPAVGLSFDSRGGNATFRAAF